MSKPSAAELHKNVPPDWYFRSLKEDPLQRYWHTRRFAEVKKLAEPAETILDIGSADGVFTYEVVKYTGASKAVGIDVLKSSVDWANRHWGRRLARQGRKIEFRLGDAHKLKFAPETFDAVFVLEVLEHVFAPEEVLQQIKRVMKKGGYAVLLVPTENWLFKIVWFLWHFYGRMVWQDTHVQHFTADALVALAKKAGFKIEVNQKFHLKMLQAIKVRKK